MEEYQKANNIGKKTKIKANQRWTPAANGNLTLYVDAAFLPNHHQGGIGGILRDHEGKFRAASTRPIPFTASPKQCELMAIRAGLDLLHSMQTRDVTIQSDCLEAIAEIKAPDHELLANGGIIDYIKHLCNSMVNVSLVHTPRTCNGIAHRLAAIGFDDNLAAIWVDNPPECILDLLQIEGT